jgi:hypothetical protein
MAYANDVNSLSKNINIIKRTAEALLEVSDEVLVVKKRKLNIGYSHVP